MSLSRISSIAAVLVLVAASSVAQSRWEQEVRNQLSAAGGTFDELGYQSTHDVYTGSLQNQKNETVTLTLRAGREYAILGVCDTDCTDLDLHIMDPSGNQVDVDIELDDFPVLEVRPPRDGTYTVRVTMATCSVSPCFYGIGVWARDAGANATPSSSPSGSNATPVSDGQDRYLEQVRNQINSVREFVGGEGWRQVGEMRHGALADDASETFTVALQKGSAYVLVGACDNDCTDVDLALIAPSGEVVDVDVETDDVPVVEVTPGRSATYTVRVSMPECSAAPCRWGVGVFVK